MNVIIGENEIFKRLRTDVTEAETVRTNAVLTFIVVVLYNLILFNVFVFVSYSLYNGGALRSKVFVLEPFEIVSLGKFLIIGEESFVDVFWKEEEEYEYIGRKEGGWGVEDVMGIVRGYLDKRGNG